MTKQKRHRLVTVCDKCFRASCWHGIFMCDDSTGAGVVDKSTEELEKLRVEHISHYSIDAIRKNCGQEPRWIE